MTKRFDKYIDRARIEAAVTAAERATTGEIVVAIAPWFWGRVDRVAERTFARLGVARTRERNGVLIFVCPRRRRCTVLGDSAIHERAGQPLWDAAVAAITQAAPRDLTAGLVRAIEQVGAELAKQFPAAPGAPHANQLADAP
ncbi:MAG: TPM domain-containing protein, partial [Kofleriaceae bacterium]